MPPAVLIHGRKGVGKDTLGRFLFRQHGYFQAAIADVLKLYLEESNPPMFLDGTEVRLLTVLERLGGWDEAKRQHGEIRELLTGFGQAARNIFGEDFWVEQFVKRLQAHRAAYPQMTHFVITDVRYLNELHFLRDYFGGGARTLKLIRPNHGADGHPSEDGLPDYLFDMVIDNSSSPHDLFAKMQMTLGIWEVEEGIAA
jgi:hypothetical protein